MKKTEIEATFINPNTDLLRQKLRENGSKLVSNRHLYRRVIFSIPNLDEKKAWVRVRDEGNQVTLGSKHVEDGGTQETEVIISDFDEGLAFLRSIGLKEIKYQENYRENWEMNKAIISIDEWPRIGTIVEIEADNEDQVREACVQLGLTWSKDAMEHVLGKPGLEALNDKDLRFRGN